MLVGMTLGTLGLIGAIALLLWAGARLFAGYPAPARRYARLSAHEAAFVTAAADATLPRGGDIPLSGVEAGIPEYLDGYLASLPRRNRTLVRLLFFLFEHVTLIFPAPGLDGFRRFTKLRPEQQRATLEAWGASPMRARRVVFTSLRTVLTMAYLSSPEVLRCMGLAPLAIESPVVDADLLYPRIGQPRSSVRWRPEDRSAPGGAALDPLGPLDPAYRGTPG